MTCSRLAAAAASALAGGVGPGWDYTSTGSSSRMPADPASVDFGPCTALPRHVQLSPANSESRRGAQGPAPLQQLSAVDHTFWASPTVG